jgi:hypothetical protein
MLWSSALPSSKKYTFLKKILLTLFPDGVLLVLRLEGEAQFPGNLGHPGRHRPLQVPADAGRQLLHPAGRLEGRNRRKNHRNSSQGKGKKFIFHFFHGASW